MIRWAAPHPIWMTFSVWPTGRGWTPSIVIAGHELSSVWHKYTEERPPEGARVLCSLCGCAGRYGEYIYKGGKWYFPDLDDEECEANILVSSWTEVFPE